MYIAYFAWAIHAGFPEFKPEDILTRRAMQLYGRVTTQGCEIYGEAVFHDMPKKGVLKVGWRQNQYVHRYSKENEEGYVRLNKPLLVLAGEADSLNPIGGVREIVARACRNGGGLEFKSYPGLDHGVMTKSIADQFAWIRDRFAGKAARSNCSSS